MVNCGGFGVGRNPGIGTTKPAPAELKAELTPIDCGSFQSIDHFICDAAVHDQRCGGQIDCLGQG